jgi:hypothetical protein
MAASAGRAVTLPAASCMSWLHSRVLRSLLFPVVGSTYPRALIPLANLRGCSLGRQRLSCSGRARQPLEKRGVAPGPQRRQHIRAVRDWGPEASLTRCSTMALSTSCRTREALLGTPDMLHRHPQAATTEPAVPDVCALPGRGDIGQVAGPECPGRSPGRTPPRHDLLSPRR